MRFGSPIAFLTLALIPLLILTQLRGRNIRTGVRFSTIRTAAGLRPSFRRHLLFLPLALRIIALVLLAFALARPQVGRERVRDVSEGIAILTVVDRSGSMAAEMQYGNRRMNRLEVVKRVFEEFVSGNGQLSGRPNDLIGMISFARYADTICPLTLSHGALSQFLDTLEIVQRRTEDGTSIGDALALAAARLETAEQEIAQRNTDGDNEYQIKSKIIILLTDGQSNAGKRTPMEAAALARDWGIKVYTIGIGGADDFVTVTTPFGTQLMPVASDIDEETLKTIAAETGGVYRHAGDARSLREIYQEIDALEKSEIRSIRYADYREIFTVFAFAALAMLLLELTLATTVFRRVP